MSDKPLHVQAAEALGCNAKAIHGLHPQYPHKIEGPIIRYECGCSGGTHADKDEWEYRAILYYDTDWGVTGPLIEKYGINLSYNGKHWFSEANDSEGDPSCYHLGPSSGFLPCDDQADTPLVSVCKTILVMKERGQL